MLTRVEIDGFKTFEDFSVDIAPFTTFLGANGAGKSNFFDALELLARLSEFEIVEAMRGVRGELTEQFRDAPDRSVPRITMAVEVLLDTEVRDPFDEVSPIKNTRMRYEVAIEYRENSGPPRPYVVEESARRIEKSSDPLRHSGGPRLRYASHKPYLDTSSEHDGRSTAVGTRFVISQDGNAGRNQHRPASRATATVLSTMRDATFPHLFALAEELRSWRFLQFDPHGLREPSDEAGGGRLVPDGGNLAAVLGELSSLPASDGGDVVPEISVELGQLVDGLLGIRPVYDRAQRRWELHFETATDGDVSARVASDGTLRLTALLCALLDPRSAGVICFEEPENGVHPQRLGPLMELLCDSVTAFSAPLAAGPNRQLLLNSHSPVVLSHLVGRDDALVMLVDRVARVRKGRAETVTMMRPVSRELVSEGTDPARFATRFEVDKILETAAAAGP